MLGKTKFATRGNASTARDTSADNNNSGGGVDVDDGVMTAEITAI